MKVLVIQQKMIGDVLTSSIICQNIKKFQPNFSVDYLINTHTYSVVKNNPYVDNFIFFEPKYKNSKKAFYVFLKKIRKEKYDIVIDAYGKLESNLITLFSGAKEKISYYKWYTKLLYTKTINREATEKKEQALAITQRLFLIKPIIGLQKKLETKPLIFLSEEEKIKAKDFLLVNRVDLSKKVIMIGVLGSGFKKTYPLSYMAKVLDLIVKNTEATLLFNYIPSQLKEAKKVYELCTPLTQSKIRLDVFAKSLRDFIALLPHCDALIGNEGGAVNMAKALYIPTFSIYAPWTDKDKWNLFKDELNVGIHLKDYSPNLYQSNSIESYKSKSLEYYKKFTPKLFEEKLKDFLKLL